MNERSVLLPEHIAAIKASGYVSWARRELAPQFLEKVDEERIPVVDIRQVRVWGIQVDDERELPGLERTAIPDEELWMIKLRAKDGACYEVDSNHLKAVET